MTGARVTRGASRRAVTRCEASIAPPAGVAPRRRRDAREREEGRRRARDRNREEETPVGLVPRGLRREEERRGRRTRIEKVESRRRRGGGGGGRRPGFGPTRRSSQVQATLPGRGHPDEREKAVGELTKVKEGLKLGREDDESLTNRRHERDTSS